MGALAPCRLACLTNHSCLFPVLPQLAAYGGTDWQPEQRSGDGWPALRDTQYSVLGLPGTGVSLAIDLGEGRGGGGHW